MRRQNNYSPPQENGATAKLNAGWGDPILKFFSPDILLHPATYQCTSMYQHSGALLQRQRKELLSVPPVSYQKVNS
jgi:hypothetical protein